MMFISRFNKLIRNRIIWAIFAFIVVVSFVAWGTRTGGPRPEDDLAGKLYGKPVTAEHFRREYFNTYLSMALMFGRPLKVTDQLNELLRKLAWRRMVVLQTAAEMGLTVAADEVTSTIEQQPFFVENGQFRRERYQAFVQSFLARINASEAQFERQVREELLINKARLALAQAAWVAPLELAQVFAQVYDTFVVSYVYLAKDDLRPEIKISETEARKYFAGHREDFKIPETVRVKYAAFPFQQFVKPESLSQEALRAYYDENLEHFSVKTTNGWASTAFEKVEDEIRAKLAWENAVGAAGDKALDFEVALAPDRAGRAPAFEAAAQAINANAQTSAFFARQGAVPGLAVDADFNQAAFNLRPTPEDYFSHPLKGSNAYYVIAFEQRRDARLPEYEEAQAAARAASAEAALQEKLKERAGELHAAAAAALEKGKSFQAALRPFGVEVVTTEAFAPKSGLPVDDEALAFGLLQAAVGLNAGELSEVIALEDGLAIAYVDARRPADQATFQALRRELEQFIKRKRAETVFYEWQEYLLKQAKFEDRVLQKRQALPEDGPPSEDSAEDADI